MPLRKIANPPNPFLSQSREYLEEPPAVKIEIYEEHSRSILTTNDSPDIPFRWSINPYRGCQHACAYCYARSTHEYLGMGAGTDFDSKLVVKINAAELLRKALAKKSWQREMICFSGVTDCYQPIEAVYNITRACLEVCRDFQTPVGLITKSFLIMRDAELLSEMNKSAGAKLYQSITFANDKQARAIEPQAPPPSRRFEAMRRLTAAGVPVGVMIGPIIPGLNDREIPRILEKAAAAGATSASYVPLRLAGSVAPVFLERLRTALPLAAQKVESRIREIRGGKLNNSQFGQRMKGHGTYWQTIKDLFEISRKKVGITDIRDSSRQPPQHPLPVLQPAAYSQQLFNFAER